MDPFHGFPEPGSPWFFRENKEGEQFIPVLFVFFSLRVLSANDFLGFPEAILRRVYQGAEMCWLSILRSQVVV